MTTSRRGASPKRHALELVSVTLTVYALLAVAYLLLPIAVVILFSFNEPAGPLQLRLAGVHARQLGPLGRGARASATPSITSLEIGAARDARGDRARDADRARARPAPLPRARRDEPARLPADGDARDRARRLAADAVPEHDGVFQLGFVDDLHRARHVHRQLRRRHREGAADRLRPPSRGGGDGPRRERGRRPSAR